MVPQPKVVSYFNESSISTIEPMTFANNLQPAPARPFENRQQRRAREAVARRTAQA